MQFTSTLGARAVSSLFIVHVRPALCVCLNSQYPVAPALTCRTAGWRCRPRGRYDCISAQPPAPCSHKAWVTLTQAGTHAPLAGWSQKHGHVDTHWPVCRVPAVRAPVKIKLLSGVASATVAIIGERWYLHTKAVHYESHPGVPGFGRHRQSCERTLK